MNLDPRTRIFLVLIISSAAILIKDIKALMLFMLMTLLLCKLFSISLLGTVKKLRKLWYFFIMLTLVQSLFTHGGDTIFALGSVRILTTAGLEAGISIILRMSIIVYSAMIIASASSMDIVYGLTAMKLPQEVGFMVLLAIKFLPLFKEEFTDSIIAVQLSGADLKRIPLEKKLSLYTYILTPSVIKALNRARYISISMECRGFRAYPTRTFYRRLKMKGADYFIILITLASTIAIFSLN